MPDKISKNEAEAVKQRLSDVDPETVQELAQDLDLGEEAENVAGGTTLPCTVAISMLACQRQH